MKRLAMLAAAPLMALMPNTASAHTHFFFGLNIGVPGFHLGVSDYGYHGYGYGYGRPWGYRAAYYGGCGYYNTCYSAPPVCYQPAPVVYYSAPPVVYSAPPVVYSPAPVVYSSPAPTYYYSSSGYYYGR